LLGILWLPVGLLPEATSDDIAADTSSFFRSSFIVSPYHIIVSYRVLRGIDDSFHHEF